MQQYHIPGGSIAIMKNHRLVYSHGLGWSDKENHIRARATTLFRIASISKTITAIAILKLVEEKKLKLDTPVFSILKNIKPYHHLKLNKEAYTITVRNLLNMTSGWDANQFDPVFDNWPKHYALPTGHESISGSNITARLALHLPLKTHPGKQFSYANLNYCLLGLIINKLTNTPYNYRGYQHFVQRHILQPLHIYNMHIANSNFNQRDPDEAIYYPSEYYNYNDPLFLMDLPYGDDDILQKNYAAGGWVATSIDLARIAEGIKSGKILSKKSFHEMMALPKTLRPYRCNICTGETTWHYGMGWFVLSNHQYSTHGSFTGSNSLLIIRKDGTIFALIFNRRPSPTEKLWAFRRKLTKIINTAHI